MLGEPGVLEHVAQLLPEQHGEHASREKETRVLVCDEAPGGCVEAAGGDEQMGVGVIAEVTTMGVQHGKDCGARAQVARVSSERGDGVGGAAQERVVDYLLVTAREGAQRRRQREGEQEVLARQQALALR
jgi:hypothetical protein